MNVKYKLPDEVREHVEGFCHAFLEPRWRDRTLAKPRELFDDFCHALPDRLRAHRALPLAGKISNRVELVMEIIKPLTTSKTAAYLGAWSSVEVGVREVEAAITDVWRTGGAVASIEPGRLAFYATEGSPKSDWYLLCDDPKRLAQAAALAKEVGRRR